MSRGIPPPKDNLPPLSTVTKGSNFAMSFISLSIEANVAISVESNVEPGPTPNFPRSAALPVT